MKFRQACLVSIAALAGCRASGYKPGTGPFASEPPVPFQIEASPAAHRLRDAPASLPRSGPIERPLFYADLGPDAVDVSAYPPRQRYNYAVFRANCSRCHTLARAINAPMASRRSWELYMAGMRFNTFFSRTEAFAEEDRSAILEFLEYDGRVRKIDDARAFQSSQEELKQSYRELLEGSLERMQRANPRPLAPRE